MLTIFTTFVLPYLVVAVIVVLVLGCLAEWLVP
jgi:hypothetical protein